MDNVMIKVCPNCGYEVTGSDSLMCFNCNKIVEFIEKEVSWEYATGTEDV